MIPKQTPIRMKLRYQNFTLTDEGVLEASHPGPEGEPRVRYISFLHNYELRQVQDYIILMRQHQYIKYLDFETLKH